MSKGKINTYTCSRGHQTVTIDADEGTTPFMIRCKQRHSEKYACTEMASSSFYACPQTLTPEYEWYKPTNIKKVSKGEREHVEMGGLLLRKIAK